MNVYLSLTRLQSTWLRILHSSVTRYNSALSLRISSCPMDRLAGTFALLTP